MFCISQTKLQRRWKLVCYYKKNRQQRTVFTHKSIHNNEFNGILANRKKWKTRLSGCWLFLLVFCRTHFNELAFIRRRIFFKFSCCFVFGFLLMLSTIYHFFMYLCCGLIVLPKVVKFSKPMCHIIENSVNC